MNIEMRKTRDFFYVDASCFSENPNISIRFLTTKPEPDASSEPFDFVNMILCGKNNESVSVSIGKDALEKFMVQLEKVVKDYNEKNCAVIGNS